MGAAISDEDIDEPVQGEEETVKGEEGDEDEEQDEEEKIVPETEEETQPIKIPDNFPKPEYIQVRVDKVNFDGLLRTNDTIIEDMVKDLYSVDNYEDLCLKTTEVRSKLAALGCFRSMEIYIDNSRGENATPNGVEVLYVVKEMPLLNYEVNTAFGSSQGTFNVVANVRNFLGRGEKIIFKSTVSTIPMSNFTLSLSRPYPNVPFQPTLNMHVIKDTNMKHFTQRKVMFDLALRANKRTHSLQLEGGDGNFLYNAIWNKPVSHSSCGLTSGTCIFAARHIVSKGDGDEDLASIKGNLSKFISEISVMGRGMDREALVKNVVDMQRVYRLANHVKLQANWQCGVLHKVPLFDRAIQADKNALSRASTFFWQLGLDLCMPLSIMLSGEKFKDFFRNNSLKPHVFVHSGGDGIITAEQDFANNVQNVSKNTQLSGGFGLKFRIGEVANMELNYCIPLWTPMQPNRIMSPGLQFGLGWKFL